MIPIWRDCVYTGSTGFQYSVRVGGETIADGVLSPYPDGIVRLPINRIAENYLSSDLDFSDGVHTHPDAARTFSLCSGDTVVATYDFILDWGYSDVPAGNYTLSNPINGHLDSRMKLLYSTYNTIPRNICYD